MVIALISPVARREGIEGVRKLIVSTGTVRGLIGSTEIERGDIIMGANTGTQEAKKSLVPQGEPKSEMAELGDGQVFVQRDKSGVIRCVRAAVTLSEVLGEIVKVQKKYMIQVAGFNKLNQVAGINILTPPSCIVDGIQQANPHVERDGHRKIIQTVTVRKIAFGYSPIGNIVAIDKTLFFNVFTYFMQDLQAKIKKYPICGCLGTSDEKPEIIKWTPDIWKEGRNGKYPVPGNQVKSVDVKNKPMIFYEIEAPVGIWVDISHKEIQACFDSHTQRQKFGDRHAQSICERNCLKAHPAIAASNVTVNGGLANVYVFGWKHDLDFSRLNTMADKISRGEASEKEVEIHASAQEATFEDAKVAEGETPVDEHGASTLTVAEDLEGAKENRKAAPPSGGTQEQEPEKKEFDIDKAIAEGKQIIGEKKYQEILNKAFSVKSVDQLSSTDKAALLALLHKMADKTEGSG